MLAHGRNITAATCRAGRVWEADLPRSKSSLQHIPCSGFDSRERKKTAHLRILARKIPILAFGPWPEERFGRRIESERGAVGSTQRWSGPRTPAVQQELTMSAENVAGRYFDVEGGQVYAHAREGDGPALIFLHYWGGSQRTWIPVLQRLDSGRGFVAYDQRGWGDS